MKNTLKELNDFFPKYLKITIILFVCFLFYQIHKLHNKPIKCHEIIKIETDVTNMAFGGRADNYFLHLDNGRVIKVFEEEYKKAQIEGKFCY